MKSKKQKLLCLFVELLNKLYKPYHIIVKHLHNCKVYNVYATTTITGEKRIDETKMVCILGPIWQNLRPDILTLAEFMTILNDEWILYGHSKYFGRILWILTLINLV